MVGRCSRTGNAHILNASIRPAAWPPSMVFVCPCESIAGYQPRPPIACSAARAEAAAAAARVNWGLCGREEWQATGTASHWLARLRLDE